MESKSEIETNSKSSIRQILICIVANMPTLPAGMTLGFTAVTIPYLTTPNPTLYVSEHEASLIASCVSLSIPLGGLFAGAIMEGFGRKFVLLLSCLPAAFGWLTIALFPSFEGVIIGRLLTGLATGFCCNSATVFIAESSIPSLRGFLINGTNLGFASGILIVYIFGFIFKENWRLVAGLGGVVPIIATFCLLKWMPESPVWLASKGRSEEALKSLAKLRADNYLSPSISTELNHITKYTDNAEKDVSFTRIVEAFSRPETYKPLLIMLTFFLFQQICGTFVMIFYGVTVVIEAGVKTDPFAITVLIGVASVIFTFVGAWASKTYGRRFCAIISGSGKTISLAILVLFLHLKSSSNEEDLATTNMMNGTISLNSSSPFFKNAIDNSTARDEILSSAYSWIPASAILTFIMAGTVGFLSLPWAMLGEVFPVVVRGVACGLCTCFAYLFNFVALLAFQPMLNYLGNKGVFAFYGVMSLLATIFVALFLPETQNKTLAQVEEFFTDKRIKIKLEAKEASKKRRLFTASLMTK